MFQLGMPAKGDERLSRYYLSEKLDGIRARWDGEQFVSRLGNTFPAPTDFKRCMPSISAVNDIGGSLDGELYIGRNKFQETLSIVRGAGHDWIKEGIQFRVFDVMNIGHPFSERVAWLGKLSLLHTRSPNERCLIVPVGQSDLNAGSYTWSWLQAKTAKLKTNGGEGYMLHRADSFWSPGRSKDILKVKSPDYGMCRVTGWFPGKGKLAGMVGGYYVEFKGGLAKGKKGKIGTGLTDIQRNSPLPDGCMMPFRHWGLTKSGQPRQPVFCKLTDLPFGFAG